MNRFIRFLSLCLLFITVFTFVACGGTQPVETVAETDTDAAPTEALTAADTDFATEAPTEAPTEAETQPPEDLSVPESNIRLLDVAHQMASKQGRKTLTMTENTANGVSFVTYHCTGTDSYAYLINDKKINPGRYLKIKYRTFDEAHGQIFISPSDIKSLKGQDIPYICDGEWHVATVDLWQNKAYSGAVINYLRFDPSDAKEHKVDVEWFAFCPDDGAALVNLNLAGLPDAEIPDLTNPDAYKQTADKAVYFRSETEPDKSTFTFKENYGIQLYFYTAYFNRYTIRYSATEPLFVTMTYASMSASGSAETKTDEFYLEAGEDMTFSSLLPNYLKSEFAYGIDSLTLTSVKGTDAEFTLLGISAEQMRVYSSGNYFLENGRYRLGILLSWGGGISYIEDKQDGDDAIGNLINRADTGRLVQQSYYGVSTSNYKQAMYGGNVWSYNPVQGGDQYGSASRIVDIRISEDGLSMYIKCRPMDWAQRKMPTPSYMENTYTLTDGGIVVDNRFVDFFNMKHGQRHQELPAFYTISYLGVFHYYNGKNPWTNDDCETLPNETFWAGRSSAYHNIVSGNTETWAAWTNTDGYGIGLYVPGVEIMLAGRYEYNGSKDPANGATNYVAPLRTMEIVSFVPWEYTYVIATGTVDEMRETFKNYYESQP